MPIQSKCAVFNVQTMSLRLLVKRQPETGRITLMVGRHAVGIPTLTTEQCEQQLTELIELVCQPPRVYEHVWRVGDATTEYAAQA